MSDAITKAVEAAEQAESDYYANTAEKDWSAVDAQRAAIAAFLDAVKDSPTEEMLDAAQAPLRKRWVSPAEVWAAMCLALRRGVES